MIFRVTWKVHHNSDRTGVRLIGPRPKWARKDGGEAGLHPSNLHDNAYAVGSMDFTGDMPILLGPDGPSLGGFVCPAVIAQAELWKIGQLRAGDTVRFRRISNTQAEDMENAINSALITLDGKLPKPESDIPEPAILHRSGSTVYRSAGDRYLLLETGPNQLSLDLRMRVHAIEKLLRQERLKGILDITPGIRSLQIHYDSRVLRREELIACLDCCEQALSNLHDMSVPSRTVYLPLSWEDPATLLAIQKYMKSVRADAPWCPSNIEFIRRINGLDSIEAVRDIVFSASYLVLGLGDCLPGRSGCNAARSAPPPRDHEVQPGRAPGRRRTRWASAGLTCVFTVEGPGGYRFVGRTIQMGNTYRSPLRFEPGSPGCFASSIRSIFFPVTALNFSRCAMHFPRQVRHSHRTCGIQFTQTTILFCAP